MLGIKKWGVAEIILVLSILILVVVVANPVFMIFWNSFVVDGRFNIKDVMKPRVSSSSGKGDSSDCGPGDCGPVERSPRKLRKQMAK